MSKQERVVCAAVRFVANDDDFIVAGVRHHACYYDPRVMKMINENLSFRRCEGFYTNQIVEGSNPPQYKFVDRVTAKMIAERSGQPLNDHDYYAATNELFSEDLY